MQSVLNLGLNFRIIQIDQLFYVGGRQLEMCPEIIEKLAHSWVEHF